MSQPEPREDAVDLRNEDFWLHALFGPAGSSLDVGRDVSIDLNSPPFFEDLDLDGTVITTFGEKLKIGVYPIIDEDDEVDNYHI